MYLNHRTKSDNNTLLVRDVYRVIGKPRSRKLSAVEKNHTWKNAVVQ